MTTQLISPTPTHIESPKRYMYKGYYVTIGLEIHAALLTPTKLMSPAPNSFSSDMFAPLDAGLPGSLPVFDSRALELAAAFGLATKSKVMPVSYFDRKHYFYSDLPIGYQITQQMKPILMGGEVEIETPYGIKKVAIEHSHLECDAAKSMHDLYPSLSAIDLSRGGSTLLEIVSMPAMFEPSEAVSYASSIHDLVVFLGVCDGKMEEGSFRMDASISISKDEKILGTRVEIKNLSSFGFMKTALEYEIVRQHELLEAGQKVQMQTVLFDEKSETTKPMRDKESVLDYRYMPDPDLAPAIVSPAMLESVKKEFAVDYFEIKKSFVSLLTSEAIVVDSVDMHLSGPLKLVWLEYLKLSPDELDRLLKGADKATLLKVMLYWAPDVAGKIESSKVIDLKLCIELAKTGLGAKEAKDALKKYLESEEGKSLIDFVPKFMSQSELEVLIQSVLKTYEKEITAYFADKAKSPKMVQFLTGKCMALVKTGSPAQTVSQTLIRELGRIEKEFVSTAPLKN